MKGKGTILKEQITFDFFEEIKIENLEMEVKNNLEKEKPKPEKEKAVKQNIMFRKQCNVKPNHKKPNRKVRRIF